MGPTSEDRGTQSFRLPSEGVVEVGVGEFKLAAHPESLMTPALGSCVAVALHDHSLSIGGLAHVMLPEPLENSDGTSLDRFASFAVPELVRQLVERGSRQGRLIAKIAGGAGMFGGESDVMSIGSRNTIEVKRQLGLLRIPLVAEDTGKAHARTVVFELDSGALVVRSYQFGIKRL